MDKSLVFALLLALVSCSTPPPPQQAHRSPCDVNEASYDCQVERYHNVNVP